MGLAVLGTCFKNIIQSNIPLEVSYSTNSAPKTRSAYTKGRYAKLRPEIKKLFDQGLSYAAIGEKLHILPSNLCHYIKKQGWTRRQTIHKNSYIAHTDLIKKLYLEKHLKATEIADRIGCSAITVRKILKNSNVETQSSSMHKKVKELYEQGLSFADIGKATGTTASNICHLVKANHWERLKKVTYKARSIKDRDLILKLYAQSLTITEIASKLGYSRPTIRKVLAKRKKQ